MRPVEFEGCEGLLEKPEDWDESKGAIGSLPVKRITVNGIHVIESVWCFSEQERKLVSDGQNINILLWIIGDMQPPVNIQLTDRQLWE